MIPLYNLPVIKQSLQIQFQEFGDSEVNPHPMHMRPIQVRLQYAHLYLSFFREYGLLRFVLDRESPLWSKLLIELGLVDQSELFMELLHSDEVLESNELEQGDSILLYMELSTALELLQTQQVHSLLKLGGIWNLLETFLPKITPSHKACLGIIKQLLLCTTKTARVKLYKELLIPTKLHSACETAFFKRG